MATLQTITMLRTSANIKNMETFTQRLMQAKISCILDKVIKKQ